MVVQTDKFTVLNPTVPPMPAHGDMAPRPESLNGKTVGLLSNGKRNADKLLDYVSVLIAEHYQIQGVVARDKGNASRPCPDDLLQELLSQCDMVVTATGD